VTGTRLGRLVTIYTNLIGPDRHRSRSGAAQLLGVRVRATSSQPDGMCPQRHAPDDQVEAASWCRHLVPQGSVSAFLADHRPPAVPARAVRRCCPPPCGHPSVPAEVIATVMVLQALEGLSDREASSALQRDIAWKVACGLRLDDQGFHPTVLVYWRARLRSSDRPRRVFQTVRQVVQATGVLQGPGRRVLDSTILEDAVATQDTVTQLVAATRRVRRLVPRPARSSFRPMTMSGRASRCVPGTIRRPSRSWCQGWSMTRWLCLPHWPTWSWTMSRPRRSRCWRWSPAKTSSRASGPGRADCKAGRQRPGDLHRRPAGAPYPQDQRAAARRLPRPHRRRARDRAGDRVCADRRHRPPTARPGWGCWPTSSPVLRCWATPTTAPGRPARPCAAPAISRRSSRSRCRVRCRAGSPSTTSRSSGTPARPGARPAPRSRSPRPARPASPATASVARCAGAGAAPAQRAHDPGPPHEDELRAARRRATTRSFQHSYRRWRPMVERSIAWLVAGGCRRVSYRGIERNEAWWSLRVAAVNLRRLLVLGLARHDGAWVLA
jgi:Transposase domain (DUF772)/Transposase DDE domain